MRSVLIILITSLLITTIYLTYEDKFIKVPNTERISSRPSPTPVLYETTQFLIPVTKFTNPKYVYSLTELEEAIIGVNEQFLDYIPTNLQTTNLPNTALDFEAYDVALVPPESVKPWYKTITIDGVESYWSKKFSAENYPFKKIITSTTKDSVSKRTTIFASGEIIPARAVDRLGLNKYDNYTYLFDSFREDIENADIAIALLENSVLGNPTPCTGCMSFVGDDKVIAGLNEVGFDMISTAGNHAGDAGQKAYANTVKLLEESNIEFTGTGNCSLESCTTENYDIWKPALKELNGITIGMLAADDVASYYWKQNLNSENFGTNSFSNLNKGIQIDQTKVDKVKDVKDKYDIDYLIIYMSWGVEYTNQATIHQQTLGKALIDAGADIIIGSHPHWVQNIEFYNNKPIIYSLGNFIFDQTHTLETRQGAAVNLHFLNNELKNIEIMPHKICGYHQTRNDLAARILNNEINYKDIENTQEKDGCIYWQPRKLLPNETDYNQILERIYEHTKI